MKKFTDAVRNSPVMLRKKLGYQQGYSLKKQHEKFDDDWLHGPIDSGVTFYVKYMGMSHVEKSHGMGSTDEAVKRIAASAKNRTQRLQKVQITISSKAIRLVDVSTGMKLDELPLYKVSYCAVDPNFPKVFCYISRNLETNVLECHAYMCSNQSKAEAVTLSVAQAFNEAYKKWQDVKKKKKTMEQHLVQNGEKSPDLGIELTESGSGMKQSLEPPSASQESDSAFSDTPSPQPEEKKSTNPFADDEVVSTNPFAPVPSRRLVRRPSLEMEDLSSDFLVKTTLTKARSMEKVFEEDESDLEFTRLAEARSNPNLLDDCNVDGGQFSEDVHQMMQGDTGPGDLYRARSLDNIFGF